MRTAVATGENLTAVGQFVPLLIHEAVDVVQVAVQGTGVTAALRIFEMADAFGLPVALVNSPGSVRRPRRDRPVQPPDDGGHRPGP